MCEYYFVFNSLTGAQSASFLLKSNAISAAVVSSHSKFASRGCGYAVRIGTDYVNSAASLLRRENIMFTAVYRLCLGNAPEEVAV